MADFKIDAKAVRKFNQLPRRPRAPSGLVDNHWHFDLRFVYLEPPCHVLFLIQPESTYSHQARLPLGIPTDSTTILFFPENGAEAAPEVAKALIHSFLDGFGAHKFERKPPPLYAPWTLSTDDSELALAVGTEFKRMGVKEELCKIGVTKAHVKTANEVFNRIWASMTLGFGALQKALIPPEGINFSVLKPAPWGEPEGLEPFEQAMKYAQISGQVGLESRKLSNSQITHRMPGQIEAASSLLESKSTKQVQMEADTGDDAAALDYAVRIQCSIGVKPNRTLHRYYLMKVIGSATATSDQGNRAHGHLIDWFTSAHKGQIFARYMFAASHHATQSIILGGDASPAPHAEKIPPLNAQYKELWMAMDKRHQEVEDDRTKAETKREKATNRYICAAPNCYIQANKGAALARCSGKCDPDVKPAYCSREYDWKNHKPFWTDKSAQVLSIPIAGPNGPMLLSSSTMTPEMLKMVQAMSFGEKPEGGDQTIDEMMSKSRRFQVRAPAGLYPSSCSGLK
ncbi:hypothetical protein C8R46DRAFT_1070334 [Mycena filopes]|nr:hypothetical protein C8R46DRAFT_1070334 [Mycena filopes]